MKKIIIALLFLSVSQFGFTQDLNKLKTYSHKAFFDMLAQSKDSVFQLKDAIIAFDKKTDSAFTFKWVGNKRVYKATDTITINKAIELDNVHFINQNYAGNGIGLHHLVFNKKVDFYSCSNVLFFNCVFNDDIAIENTSPLTSTIKAITTQYNLSYAEIGFSDCVFKNDLYISLGDMDAYQSQNLLIEYSKFYTKKNQSSIEISINNISSTDVKNNQLFGDSYFNLFIDTSGYTYVGKNIFNNVRFDFLKASVNLSQLCTVEDNIFNKDVILTIHNFEPNQVYRWDQWQNKTVSNKGFEVYIDQILSSDTVKETYDELYQNDSIFNTYKNKYRFEIEKAYKFEMSLLGNFYDFYKSQHDGNYANNVYIEIKNLETKRFEYLYKCKPSFDTFFTWKINQFLKVFSAYGTKPSQAVITSIYVILLFSLIYLFFPNSWDTMNRNKLMRRLTFFTKYFRQKEGIKEIYEEDLHPEMQTYYEFQNYMEDSKNEIPKYFIWLTKPIYYFSSYNYKMTIRILKYTDVLKGKWVDLPPKRKFSSSIIIAIWIVCLMLVDLSVKVLNALTLSLNTFTTLGFGEIPIKGLPRYLAIIEGFIGWFMLTIFSVSLISQLLN